MNKYAEWYKKLPMPMKIALLGVSIYVIYTIYTKLFDKNNTTQGWFGKLTGSSSGSTIAFNNTAGNSFYANKYPKLIMNLIDLIYEKLAGYNMNVYPEVVNKLANLSVADLKLCAAYWGEKYAGGEEQNLYNFINGEWHNGMYKPALGALKKTGYYGK